MNTQDILKDYQAIRDAMPSMKLPSLESQAYQVSVESEVLNSEAKVLAALDRFNPIAGWIGYQSGNQHLNHEPLVFKRDYGVLMNAELAGADNSALHVRYNGNGGWIVTQYFYREGSDFIADRVIHYATKDELRKLNYLRFWKEEDGKPGVRPVFACFTGFGG